MANFPKGPVGEYMRIDAELGRIDQDIDRLQEKLYELKDKRRMKFKEREDFAAAHPSCRPPEDGLRLRTGARNVFH